MNQKRSSKFILTASLVLTMAGIIILFSVSRNKAANTFTLPGLVFSVTPTPYPLPNLVQDLPSYPETLIGQIFGKKELPLNPSRITTTDQRQAENAYLDLYSENDYLPVDIQWWQEESQQVYEYVRRRVDARINEKVIVIFVPPRAGNCSARGTTFHEQPPVVMIFGDQDTSQEQIVAVLAHELGHVFIHQKYPGLSDVALSEGMATWAAGDYWKSWKGADFDSSVKSFIQEKTYLPLLENYYLEKAYDDSSPDCLIHRDILLNEMASFLDFLIQSHGPESLSALLETRKPELVDGQRVIYPPDFRNVYGLELNQLEHEWLKTLLQQGN